MNQSTINGQGYIYSLTLNNQETVEANVAGGTLSVYIASATTNGVFRADESRKGGQGWKGAQEPNGGDRS